MDKESMGIYAQSIIVIIITTIMLVLASPFGNYFAQSYKNLAINMDQNKDVQYVDAVNSYENYIENYTENVEMQQNNETEAKSNG